MPRKVRRAKEKAHRITPAAIEAWQAGDYHGLHRALHLRPWEESPLYVDPDRRPVVGCEWDEDDETAWKLQQELRRVAGEPGRGDHAA